MNQVYRNPANGWLYRVSLESDKKGEYHIEYLDPASSVIWKMDVRAAQGHPRKESVQSRLKYLAEQGGWVLDSTSHHEQNATSNEAENAEAADVCSEPKDDQGIMTGDGELFPNGTECRRHVLARAWKAAGKAQAIHVCEDQPDGVKIWLNTAEPAEYWVLTHDGEVCGERIEHCPYCEANLKIGCGDVLLVPIQIARPTSSAAVTAAADQTVAAPEQPASASTTAEPAADVCEMEASAGTAKAALPTPFDYSGLDDQTVADLHLAEREYSSGKKLAEMGLRRMADGVAMAHDTLCVTIATKCRNGEGAFTASENTFGRWCESMGLNRKAAERLLQVSKLMDGSSPREQKVLEELSPSLLYAAAKPSAPAELVQAVKDGDITTHRQYREMEAQLKEARAQRDEARAEKSALAKDCNRLGAEVDKARRRADEAEKQRDGARQALTAAKLRGDKLKEENDRLREQPIEVPPAADADAVERLAQEKAEAMTEELRRQVAALEERGGGEDGLRQHYDQVILSGRVIRNAWQMAEAALRLLPERLRPELIRQLRDTVKEVEEGLVNVG